jgi:DNA-binding response OmpR family regulator
VILVCFNIKEALDRVAACKANDWVAKPLQPDELLKKVERLLSVQSRKAFRALVSTTLQNTAGNQKFFCYSQNISTSGILIETDKHLEKGERLECSFYLPGSDQLIVQGTVMRVIKLPGRFQYGIQFNNLSRQYSQLVNNFVENSPTR